MFPLLAMLLSNRTIGEALVTGLEATLTDYGEVAERLKAAVC